MSTDATPVEPKRTPLHALHVELGARMVPFAGYSMPVQYPTGILKEHAHTRTSAGLFDVSHMGQIRVAGRHAARSLETLVPVDVIGLEHLRQRYAMFTNETGGILDDLMIVNRGDHLFLVVNAARKEADLALLRDAIGGECEVEALADRALLALQGPRAVEVLGSLAPEVAGLGFMSGREVSLLGARCFVTRSGYTGEDGFEISIPEAAVDAIARRLLVDPAVAPIGLGARDSLRLEAGLCLYGHDIDAGTTPVEANLAWALSRARRADGARPGGYPGAAIVMGELARGVTRIRVGMVPEGRAPVREGTELVDRADQVIGQVTSGGFGATRDGPIAMGYVAIGYASPGTGLRAMVRGKARAITVEKLPFVTPRYFRKARGSE
jgi:aminomethyltransferase